MAAIAALFGTGIGGSITYYIQRMQLRHENDRHWYDEIVELSYGLRMQADQVADDIVAQEEWDGDPDAITEAHWKQYEKNLAMAVKLRLIGPPRLADAAEKLAQQIRDTSGDGSPDRFSQLENVSNHFVNEVRSAVRARER